MANGFSEQSSSARNAWSGIIETAVVCCRQTILPLLLVTAPGLPGGNKPFIVAAFAVPSAEVSWLVTGGILIIGWFWLFLRYRKVLHKNRQIELDTERTERMLRETRATLQNIIEHSGSAIITVNRNARIEIWNRRAAIIFGYSKNQVAGKALSVLDIENDPYAFGEIIHTVSEEGELHQLELRKRRGDGGIAELVATITPLKDTLGQVYSYVITMEDFSERNQLIDSVISHEKLLAGISALNQLLGTLSHHINNSIMAISGLAQLASLDDRYNEKFLSTTNTQVNRIRAVLQSLSKLVEQLNLKTRDYVGEKARLFDIESEIDDFLVSLEQAKEDSRE